MARRVVGQAIGGWATPKAPKKPPVATIGQPKPKAPAAGSPAASPALGAPAAAPIAPPVSLTAGASTLAAGNTLNDTLANLNSQSDQASVAYGFNPDGTPNLSNPYSRAALLRQAHERTQRANLNSASNPFGGHYQNVQNFEAQGFLQKRDSLQRTFQNLMDNLDIRRRQAQTQATNTTILAKAQAADQGFST